MKLSCLMFLLLINVIAVYGQNPDIWLLRKINSPAQGGDNTMRFFTNSIDVVSVGAPMTMLITSWVQHDRELRLKSYETAAAVVLSEGIPFGLKHLLHRQRPYIEFPQLFTGKENDADYSFPSAHSSVAFATATSLSINFPKWYVIVPSYAYAATVAYSRMYLGVHYPSDVLVGAIIGSGSAVLSWKLHKLLRKKVIAVKN